MCKIYLIKIIKKKNIRIETKSKVNIIPGVNNIIFAGGNILYEFCENKCFKNSFIYIICRSLKIYDEDILEVDGRSAYVNNITGSINELRLSYIKLSIDLYSFSKAIQVKKISMPNLKYCNLNNNISYTYDEVQYYDDINLKDIFKIKSKKYCGSIKSNNIWSIIKCPQITSIKERNLIKVRKKILFVFLVFKELGVCKLLRYKIITEAIKLNVPEFFKWLTN